MTDTTEPTASSDSLPLPLPLPPPDSNPPGWLLSPYKMAPAIEGEAVVLAQTEAEQQDVPTQYAFDPTKPTIDQTRSAAITSIRDNFAALAPAATINPALYLTKANPVATGNMSLTQTGSSVFFTMNAATAGQWSVMQWGSVGITRFDMMTDGGGGMYCRTYDAAGTYKGSAWVFDTTLAVVSYSFDRVIFHPGPPTAQLGRSSSMTLDMYRPGTAGVSFQETANNALGRVFAQGGSVFFDFATADVQGQPRPVQGPTLFLRSWDTAGSVQTRLSMDPLGGINIPWGSIASSYAYVGTQTGYAMDFRKYQTYAIDAGSSIASFVFGQGGQVSRIWVASPGAITLPTAGVYYPQGGAVWGAKFTIISVLYIHSSAIFLSFTPYD
jgi:hypothetical protein